jgi:hypothetical protein
MNSRKKIEVMAVLLKGIGFGWGFGPGVAAIEDQRFS